METPSTNQPPSGSVLVSEVSAPPVPPAPPPPTASVGDAPPPPETIVVPAAADTVPQAEAETSTTQVVAPSGGGGRWLRRVLTLIIFLVVLGGLIFVGRFVWNMLSASRQVTLTYWGLWESDSVLQPVIADFETNNPNIKVEYIKQSPKQYRERLQAAIDRGEGPDVFRFHNTWVPMLKNELSFVPTAVMTTSDFSNAFYPVASADLVADSTIYGIPMMIDGLGLYYNEDLFTSAGVTPPTTWEDVLTLVPKLTVKNENTLVTSAIALGTAGNIEHFSDILATMMMQNGARLTAPIGKEAEEALIFYRKFSDPADPVYTWNETFDNSIVAFANGRVAMILAPSWRAFDIKQLSANLHFKIVPIPQLPGNTVTWASYWVEGVSAKSKNQPQAWEFVKYLTSPEAVTKLYTQESQSRLFGEPYARVELGNTLVEDPFVGAYIKQAPDARSFPLASRTFDNGLNDKLIKYLEDGVNGLLRGSAPAAVLQTAAAGFSQVLSTYGLSSQSAPASP